MIHPKDNWMDWKEKNLSDLFYLKDFDVFYGSQCI